ncbi:MAG: hypothetical protein Ct9H300mP19_21140 [Dehalococcoidia bacterium]|nr:MAG: hypothetical protein Ct9H300mP19_21140 [Dehalococcoidia bacterium]
MNFLLVSRSQNLQQILGQLTRVLYLEMKWNRGSWCWCLCCLDNLGNNFESARIALASVGPIPILANEAGDSLSGKPVNDETIAAAAKLARNAASPITDMRGTIEQRKHLIEVLTDRMLKQAVERAKG